MDGPLAYDFRQITAFGLEIFQRDVAQRLDHRETLREVPGCLLAFRAALVVFAAGETVAYHRVADNESHILRNGQKTVFERPAIKQKCVTSLPMHRDEYVGAQCGIMDQFVAVNGKRGHALVLDCRALEYRLPPIPENA